MTSGSGREWRQMSGGVSWTEGIEKGLLDTFAAKLAAIEGTRSAFIVVD
jgi:hypothetical protein